MMIPKSFCNYVTAAEVFHGKQGNCESDPIFLCCSVVVIKTAYCYYFIILPADIDHEMKSHK